jgi:hypothetical protein
MPDTESCPQRPVISAHFSSSPIHTHVLAKTSIPYFRTYSKRKVQKLWRSRALVGYAILAHVGKETKTHSAGSELASIRWANATAEERKEAARNAVNARWERWRAEHPEKAKKKKAKKKPAQVNDK